MYAFMPVWVALGRSVDGAQTSGEAIAQAGLDWGVKKVQLQRTDDNGKMHSSNGHALVRVDRNMELAVVGKRYRPYQNKSAFDALDPFIRSGLVEVIAAGCIFDGERVFVLAKVLGTEGEIDGEPVDLHILLTNSHGYGAVTFGFVPVLRNSKRTLSPIAWKTGGSVKASHTGDVEAKITKLRDAMDLATGQFIVTLEQYENMKKKGLTSESFKELVKVALDIKDVEGDDSRKLAKILERGGKVTNCLEAYMVLADYLSSDAAGRNANSILKSLWYGAGRKDLNSMFETCITWGASNG